MARPSSYTASPCLSLLFGFIAFLLFFLPSSSVVAGPLTIDTLSLPDITENIVGGGSATPGQFPFIVSLRTVSSNSHFCGGTIHTSRYVLTAAHCVAQKVSLNVKVVAGSTLLSSGGISYSVFTITSHPNYNAYTLANDVAVLRTSSTMSFTSQLVQPIAISADFIAHNLMAVAGGWGVTTGSSSPSDELQWISLTTITNSMCKSMHGSSDAEKVTDCSLCTFSSAGQGLCSGDSGGPLVFNNQLVGVISWGVPCAQGKPDVYTRISSVYSWIVTVVV